MITVCVMQTFGLPHGSPLARAGDVGTSGAGVAAEGDQHAEHRDAFSLFSNLVCCAAEEAAVTAREHVSSAAEAAALSAREHFSSMINLAALGQRDSSSLTPALDTRPATVALEARSHDRLVPVKARVGGIDERLQVRYSRGKYRTSLFSDSPTEAGRVVGSCTGVHLHK